MCVLLIEHSNIDQAVSLRMPLEEGGYSVISADTPSDAAQELLAGWPSFIVFHPDPSLNLTLFKQAFDQTNLDVPCIVVGKKAELNPYNGNNVTFIDPDQTSNVTDSIQAAASEHAERFRRLPGFVIDLHKRSVLRKGKTYNFTPKEFKLLTLLLEYQNVVLNRKIIMKEVWDTEYMGDTRTLDVHIRWIREKIENNPSKPRYLITVRGVGYRFVTNTD